MILNIFFRPTPNSPRSREVCVLNILICFKNILLIYVAFFLILENELVASQWDVPIALLQPSFNLVTRYEYI